MILLGFVVRHTEVLVGVVHREQLPSWMFFFNSAHTHNISIPPHALAALYFVVSRKVCSHT